MIALNAKQFQRAVQATPQFVLMLMSIMIDRLRLTDAMLGMTRSLPEWGAKGESTVFDKRLLDELRCGIARARRSAALRAQSS